MLALERHARRRIAAPVRPGAWLALVACLWFVVISAGVLHQHHDAESSGDCILCQMVGSVAPDLPTDAATSPDAIVTRAECACGPSAAYHQPLLDASASPRGPPPPAGLSISS
jgi:hypothetical protein